MAACAQGNTLPPGGGAGGTGPGPGGSGTGAGGVAEAGPSGIIGSPCKSNADCTEGACSPIGNASYCTEPCPPACPEGTYCTIIGGNSICAPDLDQQCLKCTATTDCKLPTDVCLTAPLGDKFCARDCSVDGLCPNGFTCLDKPAYDAEADAGAGDAGAKDGGADGGPPPSAAYKWCVPNSGFSCPCNSKRDGVAHACSVGNASGTCHGQETCDGKTAQWQGCTAGTPAPETCNGKDDNCDGMTDEGDPNTLCAASGPKPTNGSWACKNGMCSLGACDPGWTSFPGGSTGTGCNCALEPGEPNGTCGVAMAAGMVTDTGAPITIQGTLSSVADVDFWTFDAIDTDELTTNSYHVSIAFTAPAPNDEFLIDVMRGDPCSDTPTGPGTGIIAYDWCVNGTDGAAAPAGTGEAPCGPTDNSHCGGTPGSGDPGSHTAKYYVRVYRRPGATASCAQYQLTISGGGGTCDLTQKCP
jgi:hypothetical protein